MLSQETFLEFLRFNRKLLSHLNSAAWGAWNEYVLEETAGDARTTQPSSSKSGMAAALHAAGDLLAWHPHSHNIALFGTIDEAGTGAALFPASEWLSMRKSLINQKSPAQAAKTAPLSSRRCNSSLRSHNTFPICGSRLPDFSKCTPPAQEVRPPPLPKKEIPAPRRHPIMKTSSVHPPSGPAA